MKPHLVSVIIPAYNSGKFIKAAIESVLNQSFDNLEVIVFDDGSSDSTIQICESFQNLSNFRLIKANNHTGNIAKLRNYSVDIAKGEFIAFLDSDDLWERNKIEEQLKYIDKYDFICTNAKVIDESDKILSESYFSNLGNMNKINLENLLLGNLVITSTVLSRKELIINGGYFSEELGNIAEDYALWLNIARQHTFKYINYPLIRYRRHESNISYKDDLYRVNMLLETIRLRNQFVSNNKFNLKEVAIKGIIELKKELVEIYLKKNRFISSFKNMSYILWNFNPKLSIKYYQLYLGFIYLLIKKLIKGVFLSKR